MEVVLNLIIIALAGLIAYWWANQGLFSALLHLLCVIAAGAIALGTWELVAVNLTLRGGFEEYAWGVTLMGLFIISLVVLRVAMDRLVPANVDLPHWANLAFGGILGAGAGIITMGIFLISAGMLQSDTELFNFRGWARSRGGQVTQIDSLWLPMHRWTNNFYDLLSVGSFRAGRPLKQYHPEIWKHAQSLVRDGYENKGRLVGKTAINPAAVQVKNLFNVNNQRYAVELSFDAKAFDNGTMLTLSKSQIKLIGDVRGTTRKAPVAYPDAWSQETSAAPGRFLFDDRSHYVTSVPARQSASVVIEFPAAELQNTQPRFLMIKGTRFTLPQAKPGGADLAATLSETSTSGSTTVDASARPIPDTDLTISHLIPVQIGTNRMPGTLERSEENYLTSGRGTSRKGQERPPRALRIQGIEQPADTCVLQLDVSRGKVCDVEAARTRSGETATPVLVDSNGQTFKPIGYILDRGDEVEIFLNPSVPISALNELPSLPTAGTHTLRLVFRVTKGVTIAGFKVGDQTLGTSTLLATPRS
jgi:hypothetical protein